MSGRGIKARIQPDPECLLALSKIGDDIAEILDTQVRLAPVSEFDQWTGRFWAGAVSLSGPDGVDSSLVHRAVRLIANDVLESLTIKTASQSHDSIGLDIRIKLDPDTGLQISWKFAILQARDDEPEY